MSKCKFCGAELEANSKFCSSCGGKVQASPVVNLGSKPQSVCQSSDCGKASTPTKRRAIKGGMLAWSIVNATLGFFGSCACLPIVSAILGITSIVMVILAQDSKTEALEKSKIRIALILNIIASVILVISLISLIVLAVYGMHSYIPYNHNTFDIDDFMQLYPYLD